MIYACSLPLLFNQARQISWACVYNQRHPLCPPSLCCPQQEPIIHTGGGPNRWPMVSITGKAGGTLAHLWLSSEIVRLWGWRLEEGLQQQRRAPPGSRGEGMYALVEVCVAGEGVYLCGGGVTSCHTTGKSARLSHICQHAGGAMPEGCRVRGHDAPCKVLRSRIQPSQ